MSEDARAAWNQICQRVCQLPPPHQRTRADYLLLREYQVLWYQVYLFDPEVMPRERAEHYRRWSRNREREVRRRIAADQWQWHGATDSIDVGMTSSGRRRRILVSEYRRQVGLPGRDEITHLDLTQPQQEE